MTRSALLRMFSSSRERNSVSAADAREGTRPVPLQCVHAFMVDSPSEGRKRWRDISRRPNVEIGAI